jgi:hypothetical protein
LGYHHPPRCPQELVPFHRPHSSFFRENPIRFKSRRTVESLRFLPVMCPRNRRLSETDAARRCLMSSSSNFSMFLFAFGDLPDPFLGVRESPRWAILA